MLIFSAQEGMPEGLRIEIFLGDADILNSVDDGLRSLLRLLLGRPLFLKEEVPDREGTVEHHLPLSLIVDLYVD